MAWSFDVNNAAGTGSNVIYALKELLKSVGWTVTMSGGGLGSGLYSAVGDVIVDPGGQGKMDVNFAWFVIRQPVAPGHPQREFLFQRRTFHDSGYGKAMDIWVSPEDGFSSAGTNEATIPSIPPDGHQLAGIALGVGYPLFPIDNSYKYHLGVDGAAPWGWYAIWSPNGGIGNVWGLVFDPLQAGSFPSSDADPAVYVFSEETGVNGPFFVIISGGFAKWWFKKGLAAAMWVSSSHALPYYSSGYGTTVPDNVGANPNSSAREHFPIPWGRGANHVTQVGWKGFLSVLRWTGADLVNFDTLSVAGVRERIVVDLVTLPWPDIAPIL